MSHRSYKFRLYPTEEQKVYFAKSFGCCRKVYNHFLDLRQKYYAEKKTLKGFKQPTEKELKVEFPFLKEVSNCALQQARRDLDAAYSNFFQKIKKGEKTALHFRSGKGKQSFRELQDRVKVDFSNKLLKIPKLDWIQYRDPRTFAGKIRNVTISRSPSGKYFASILVEEQIQQLPPAAADKMIGIDLGISHFLTDDQSNTVENSRYFEKARKKLAVEQRKLARKVKGSNNYKKQCIKVTRCQEKIANQRKDFQHKLSTQLINENQVICCETLAVKKMIMTGSRSLSRNLADAAFSSFLSMLKYKAEWRGRELIQIDQYFASSKICFDCGWKKADLQLSDRVWTCENCGAEHSRDHNAAKNILQRGLEILVSRTAGTVGMACRDREKSSITEAGIEHQQRC